VCHHFSVHSNNHDADLFRSRGTTLLSAALQASLARDVAELAAMEIEEGLALCPGPAADCPGPAVDQDRLREPVITGIVKTCGSGCHALLPARRVADHAWPWSGPGPHVFSSLDGYGSHHGDWGGYWGKQGPELLDHRLAVYDAEQRMVFGASTYRQFARMLGPGRNPGCRCARTAARH